MELEKLTLRQKLGQMLVTGLPGGEVTREWEELLDRCPVGNVILFKYNQLEHAQLRKLCGDLSRGILARTGIAPFITSDEEGGVVSRLPSSMAKMPSAMAQASLGDADRIRMAAQLSGRELLGVGINFNLAPVLDINNNRDNPVIGVRSYGTDAESVSQYAMAAYEGYTQAGILTVGKHFPGHGDTVTDSHLALPVIQKSLAQLEQLELIPFRRAIEKGIPAITIAHILFPSLETEQVPATMSRKIITGLLREKLGFQGLVISDCMEMNAIKEIYGIPKGAVEAVRAGMDLIFISRSHSEVLKTMDSLEQAVISGYIPIERIEDAVGRILAYKEQYLREAPPLTEGELRDMRAFADHFAGDAIAASISGPARTFALGTTPLFLSPPLSQVTMATNLVDSDYSFAEAMYSQFGGDREVVDIDPSAEDIDRLLDRIHGYTSVVLGTVNGNSHPGQMELAEKVLKSGVPFATVALRNPFELAERTPECFSFALYEYSRRTVELGMRYFTVEE